MELPKNYEPKKFENKIYKMWEENNYFKAEVNYDKEPYSIVLPPPNITGQLHIGHALDHTLQDVLIRYKRMNGYETLWQPGTDHASIATEVKVAEKIYEESKMTKEEYGRENFLKRAYKWKDEYGDRIVDQMKQLGNSCDWSKERFTMDEGLSDSVLEFFVRLYNKGLIYKGNRIVNWCPSCETSISDAEVEHEEKEGNFWHIEYKLKDSSDSLIIATTRPETILGDTAIAVNPNDERYKDYIGKKAILPLLNREIPIVGDDYVDIEMGTGALKVTPCHDPNDFEIGKRNDLEEILIFDKNAIVNKNGGKYEGLDRYEARKKIIEDLKSNNQLKEIKKHDHNVGVCHRCNTIIEPMTSEQWFVKMEDMAKKAIEVVKDNEIEFVPERFNKIYFNWLENIKDWCISRQLWWGHRIPAYYCDDCDNMMVSKTEVKKCDSCGSNNIRQDKDVLDTWFSSALWPFSTLGWPEDKKELDYFFPTNVLVTGYDIIFFWVVRMVFSSLECTGKIPFKYVFLHGLVRDADGKKMSKSLGNGVDPLDVIDKYGSDALRLTLISGNTPGNDMRFHFEKLESSRNFANKLWNASRFIMMNIDDYNIDYDDVYKDFKIEDKWIISRLNTIINEVNYNMDKFELGIALQKIYDFTWNEYCDWYIEIGKVKLNSENEVDQNVAKYTLIYILKNILKLLHPFMPFITEEIWASLKKENDSHLIVFDWPKYKKEYEFTKEEEEMKFLMDSIRSIRNIRAEMNVIPSKKANIFCVTEDNNYKELLLNNIDLFKFLANGKDIVLESKDKIEGEYISTIVNKVSYFIPVNELIDIKEEINRLKKDLKKLEGEVKRCEGKLKNEGFTKKAPEKLVNEEKTKLEKYKHELEETKNRIIKLEKNN